MRNIVWFIKNIWGFRNALWYYRTWDYSYIHKFEEQHLKNLRQAIQDERCLVSVNAPKKVKRIDEMLALLKRMEEQPYLDMYYEFGDMEWKDLGNGYKQLVGTGMRYKTGVNHKKVDNWVQERQDWDRYYDLVKKHGQGLWV